MTDIAIADGRVLLVASRGAGPEHGLTRWACRDGAWRGEMLAPVEMLSSLARHPRLPVVYGTTSAGEASTLRAWRIDAGGATPLGQIAHGGTDPCHIAVDPTGRLLVASNYTSSALTVQPLADDGSFAGAPEVVPLAGSGPERDRQEAAHPHQAIFDGARLLIIDLGADLVREFAVDPDRPTAAALAATRVSAVPANTGPRHAVILSDGRLAISGELASSLIVGRPGVAAADWAVVASTRLREPAKTRHTRNYPGDLQRSADGRFVYLANRSHDTVATFDVSGAIPVLVSEIDTGTAWPQHLLVIDDHVLVAGWDSGAVHALPLAAGIPASAHPLFSLPDPVWLLAW